MKPKKPEVWWCIKSGSTLLPFTARPTKRDCVAAYSKGRADSTAWRAGGYNKVVKIFVTEVSCRTGQNA